MVYNCYDGIWWRMAWLLWEQVCDTWKSIIMRAKVVDPNCWSWKAVSSTYCLCDLGKVLELSMHECPHLWNGNRIYSVEFIWRLNKSKHWELRLRLAINNSYDKLDFIHSYVILFKKKVYATFPKYMQYLWLRPLTKASKLYSPLPTRHPPACLVTQFRCSKLNLYYI